ncbi:hypothetical protein T06_2884 [Trichinella sp. T6]|nr:hypothetical protein T06_2884 [Trichinella sp. T6]
MGSRKVNADSDVPEEKNKAEAEPPAVTENPLQRRTKITHHHPEFGLDGNEQKMDAEMDSVITNTGVSEKYTMKQEFVLTQRNQQKLVYIGRCYTLKRNNRNDKYWICASLNRIGIRVIRTDEHAEGCRVDAHAFYHQLQLNELKRLAQAGPEHNVLQPFEEIPTTSEQAAGSAAYCRADDNEIRFAIFNVSFANQMIY